uniref:Uncharacterized protein n=1 Tax=Anopheles dirus TaxID=7168 RepID=A0A182NXD4_9DIPT
MPVSHTRSYGDSERANEPSYGWCLILSPAASRPHLCRSLLSRWVNTTPRGPVCVRRGEGTIISIIRSAGPRAIVVHAACFQTTNAASTVTVTSTSIGKGARCLCVCTCFLPVFTQSVFEQRDRARRIADEMKCGTEMTCTVPNAAGREGVSRPAA